MTANIHYIKEGNGPAVLCLHSSTSSSKQWSHLIKALAGDFTVYAPDLYGYGKSPEWTENRALELDDEIELMQPLLDEIAGPFHLVGHSYGGATAFHLAMKLPRRIRSLVIYEPVLFNLLFQTRDLDPASEIWVLQDDIHWLLVDKRYDDAARRFIDYWSGEGFWDKLPEWQQEAIKKRMSKVRADFDATLGNLTPLHAYRKHKVPTLFLYGLQSPNSTQRITDWIGRELPHAEIRGILPMGHMGPVTHMVQISNVIEKFIRNQPTGIPSHHIRRIGE